MTVATPKHAEHRPFGAARIIVGVLSGLLSLALNFIVLLAAVFGSASALIIMGVELAIATLLGFVVARRRNSRARPRPHRHRRSS